MTNIVEPEICNKPWRIALIFLSKTRDKNTRHTKKYACVFCPCFISKILALFIHVYCKIRVEIKNTKIGAKILGSIFFFWILFWSAFAFAGITTYDFATGAGTNKWAYETGVTAKPPAANDVPANTTVTYSAISTNNGTMDAALPNLNATYAAQRFRFTITQPPAEVRQIYAFWNGIGNGRTVEGAELYIWNFNTGSYVSLGSTNLVTEVDLTGTITQNCSYYIDAGGNLYLIVVGNDSAKGSLIRTDYVKVDITYNSLPTVSINSAAQKTDGTGQTTISIQANDPDLDNSRASVYYGLTAGTCTNKATMTGTATATVTPVPDITSSNVYQIGDTTSIKTTAANTVTFNWDTKTDLPNVSGTYWIKITINDEIADCAVPPTTSVNIDNTTPSNPTVPASAYRTSAKLNSIADNTWQNADNTPYFEWAGAADTGSGVSGYSVYWGTNSSGEPGLSQGQTASTLGETSPVSDGVNYLRVRTFDNRGNYSSLVTLFTFKYDNTAPLNPASPCPAWWTTAKVNPISNDTWQSNDNTPYFEWAGVFDGTGSGVSGYSLYWGADSNGEPGLTQEQSGNSYEAGTPAPDGTSYLRARTFDNSGLYSDIITLFTFKYDNTAPANPVSCSAWDSSSKGTVISNNFPQNIDNTPYFEWTGASDGSGSGVSGYSVYWGTDSNGEPGLAQGQSAANYNVVAPTGQGTYYLRVRTFDILGKYSNPATLFTFIYDNTKPTATISVLPNPCGHSLAGGLQFKLVFSESMDTGIAPNVTYDPAGAAGAQPASLNGAWSTTTFTNDTYTVYNSNQINSSTGDGTAAITVTGAKDKAGNIMLNDTNDTFVINTAVHHFVISHDGGAMVDTPEAVTITAKNITNCTVWDYTGQITVSTLNEAGEISWALGAGLGVFVDGEAGVDTAAYTFAAGDNGVVSLNLTASASSNLDVEVSN